MSPEQIKMRLSETYPNAETQVWDLTGTQNHYQVYIKCEIFAPMTRIQRHKHVMAAFESELQSGEVHALTIKTDIPSPQN